jgi:ubiquinone/menaquinone biosynthesis C-methylase UbiE
MQEFQDYFKANQLQWDARVAPHLDSDFYDMKGFLEGKTSLKNIELEGLGDVKGKKLLHLQCHFGQDTMSWARMGAQCTGVDFSQEGIAKARQLNAELGLDVTFIEANVYDLPKVLDEKFDIVFTSYGTIIWLPDLDLWAKTIAHFLKDDGIFYIADFHPFLQLFNFEKQTIEYDYFNTRVYREEFSGTYADNEADLKGVEYFWQHSLSETTNSLIANGLQIIDFQEFNYSPYNCFSNMKEVEKDKFVFGDFGVSLPHTFSIKAVKKAL